MGAMPTVLVLLGSPRRGKNSETLADCFLESLQRAGCQVDKLSVSNLAIKPCTGCEACSITGRCVIRDDMDKVYSLLDTADWVVLTSPVYFNSITGSLKVLIDRCQVYWARKFVLKQPPLKTDRRGFLLMSAGISQNEQTLYGSWRVADYFFKAQDIVFVNNLCIDKTDSGDEEYFAKIHEKADRIAKAALAMEKTNL